MPNDRFSVWSRKPPSLHDLSSRSLNRVLTIMGEEVKSMVQYVSVDDNNENLFGVTCKREETATAKNN